MGAFDNLIPTPTPDQPQGAFDNLIPDPRFKDKRQAGSFDHLIPKNDRKPAELPQRASAPKMYWDAAKSEFTDLTGEFKKGFGDKNPIELFKTESLPAHLVQGFKRDNHISYDVDTSGGLIATDTSKPSAAKKDDKTDPGMIADLKALGVATKDHPGLVIGSLTKSVVADPELLLPWLWEAIPEATAAKVAQAAKAMGASVDIAKAAEIGGRVAGRMATGGAVNTTVEAADQFSKGEYDAGKLGRAAAEGAAMSVPGRFAGKEKPGVRVSDEAPVELTPEQARVAAKIPEERATAVGTTRESLAQATKEDPITPEMITEVAKEPIKSPTESRERLVRAVKQAAFGGAIGAGLGYGLTGNATGVESGLALGAALPLLKARKYVGPDISELINARNGQVKVVARHIYQFQHQIEKAVPVKADRERLAEMIDHGVEPASGTPEHDAHQNLKAFFRDLGEQAQKAGVVSELRDNYISHIVEEDPTKQAGLIAKLFGTDQPRGTGAKSFGRERKYDTFEELQEGIKDSGLRVKTKDASEIAGIYANAVYKSIADKRLIDALKETRLPDGPALVMPIDKAPRNYVQSSSRALAGNAVHPDIAHDLDFVFGKSDVNAVFRKLSAITSAAKRLTISMSLFHAKSLWEGFMIASNGSLGERLTPISVAKAALKTYREGGNNDALDHLIKHGLQIGTPEDVAGREVGSVLSRLSDLLNESLPLKGFGTGLAAKGLAAVDRNIEHFTFGFLQSGLKINVALSEFERMVSKGVERDRAARLASTMANDVFGSLDWYRVATDTDSHLMRKLGTASLNQNARRVLQLAMFAPDWTLATFRTMAKGLPGGARDALASQMYRRYMLKAAIYYFSVANAVNYATSGHSIFENKNPLRIDLGDGRTMQFSKHETEPMEWLRDPVNTAANKLAFLPAAALQVYRDHTIKAAYKKPAPTLVDDAKTVAEKFTPISAQQFIQNGFEPEALFGAIGLPIYGKTAEQKSSAKAESAERNRKAREEKAHEKLYGVPE